MSEARTLRSYLIYLGLLKGMDGTSVILEVRRLQRQHPEWDWTTARTADEWYGMGVQ